MTVEIPFVDAAAAYRELRPELDAAYRRVMESGWYVLGTEVEAFESEFAKYCGARFCVGVGNGLDALSLILRAMEIGPGAEVLVPSHTFVATWLAVTTAGATPVAIDCDVGNFNLDPRLIGAKVTSRTRAIIPVHLYGRPADMDAVRAAARRFGLRVVEDAAQAHGASYKGVRAGALGDAAAFSFYPIKNLGAFGDGGAVVTDDPELAERVRLWRNYGSTKKYHHDVPGVNSRLDPLQAAFLRVKLAHLDDWNERRRRMAKEYEAAFGELESSDFHTPSTSPDLVHAWHLYVIRCRNRDQLQSRLQARGIQTGVHYPVPPHLARAYGHLGHRVGDFPVAETLSATVLSLPFGPHLRTEHRQAVAAAVIEEISPR